MEKLKMEKNFRIVELAIRMDKLSIMEDLEIIWEMVKEGWRFKMLVFMKGN